MRGDLYNNPQEMDFWRAKEVVMEAMCEFANRCGFFKKFGAKHSVAWRGLVESYCRGGLVGHCERHKLYASQGRFLNDEIMPDGREVPAVFKLLQ